MNDHEIYTRVPKHIGGRAMKNGVIIRGRYTSAATVKTKDGYETRIFKTGRRKDGETATVLNIGKSILRELSSSAKILWFEFRGERGNVKNLFKYHGAEHQVIHCYEKGLELTEENASVQPLYHPRCGTSLATDMALLRLIMYLVPKKIRNAGGGIPDMALTAASFALGYKVWRYCGKNDGLVAKALSIPGKAVQKLTVQSPEKDMLTCAVKSAWAVMESQQK